MNAHHYPCLCDGCKATLGPDGVAATRRVMRRARDATTRARRKQEALNAPAIARAARPPNPDSCAHCGAEWGDLCPCTPEGLARLLGTDVA
jgi:hypothetical protein